MPVAHAVIHRGPESSFAVWSAPLLKTGASLTAPTVIVTVATFESAPAASLA
jgi:hypothetical protein